MSILRLWFIHAGLAVAVLLAGCEDVGEAFKDVAVPEETSTGSSQPKPAQHETAALKPADAISVASFNIQVFGVSKLKKPQVMDVLAAVVRRFDIVAIQEIRSKDQTVIPQFLERINKNGARYDYVLGPRLGRTSSKEQYAFLFDTKRIEVSRSSVYTPNDRGDRLHREPLVARFRVRSQPTDRAFTFSLVRLHPAPNDFDQSHRRKHQKPHQHHKPCRSIRRISDWGCRENQPEFRLGGTVVLPAIGARDFAHVQRFAEHSASAALS